MHTEPRHHHRHRLGCGPQRANAIALGAAAHVRPRHPELRLSAPARLHRACALVVACILACSLSACTHDSDANSTDAPDATTFADVQTADNAPQDAETDEQADTGQDASSAEDAADEEEDDAADADALWAALDITEDYRESFVHGEKGAQYQKYIVLHDTESTGDADSVIDWWDSNGNLVAAHFVINTDGSIVQCVPLDSIAHHAGFGDTGHNELYGVEDESRDDKLGTTSIGSSYADYGMNSYSIGIELVHVGGAGDYPTEQLEALDGLIAYIDAYYGFESDIIDHKAWRTSNSDTSEEFATYLANYQDHRTHD